MTEDKSEQLTRFLNVALDYLKDPKASVPTIVESIQNMAAVVNNEFNGLNNDLEISELSDLQGDIFIDFLSRHNPNGLTAEQIGEQISAIIKTNQIDGYVSPQEMLGSLVIAGGIVDEGNYMDAQSFQMASEILEEIGMPDQTDVYGTTLAHYLNAAKYDIQNFVNSFSAKPEPPSPPTGAIGEQDVSYKLPGAGQSN